MKVGPQTEPQDTVPVWKIKEWTEKFQTVVRKKYKEEHVYSVALLVRMSGMHSWKTLRTNSHYYCVHWGIHGFPNKGVAATWKPYCSTHLEAIFAEQISRMTSFLRIQHFTKANVCLLSHQSKPSNTWKVTTAVLSLAAFCKGWISSFLF